VPEVPLSACAPLQPPEAVQLVALAALQLRVEFAPLLTVAGLATNVTVGAGGITVTVALSCAVPPAPLQLSVYVVVAVSAPVDWVPLAACEPLQPPLALQLLALLALQARVDAAPLLMLAGLAVSVTVGAGGITVTVALSCAVPPAPVQLNV
jgi:hypothetical protein